MRFGRAPTVFSTALFVSALILPGCGAKPSAGEAKTAEFRGIDGKPLPQLPPVAPDPFAVNANVLASPAAPDALALAPIDQPTYEKARAMAREGKLREAKRLLAKLALAYPNREALIDDYNQVSAQIDSASALTRSSLEAHTLKPLPAPPLVQTLVRPARVAAGSPMPKLVLRQKTRNDIVDGEAWYEKNGVHRPEYLVPPSQDFAFAPGVLTIGAAGEVLARFTYVLEFKPSPAFLPDDLPLWIPLQYGSLPLTHAIDSRPMNVAIYGDRVIAVFDEAKGTRALFDLESFTQGNGKTFELVWALARDGALYVEHTNREYAKENGGKNAYISALDIDSGELLWRSAPLVANAQMFVLLGAGVVAGYGYTAEPDFVFVLDAATGATKEKTRVPSGPDEIIVKDGRLYVRTYDHDVVFDVR